MGWHRDVRGSMPNPRQSSSLAASVHAHEATRVPETNTTPYDQAQRILQRICGWAHACVWVSKPCRPPTVCDEAPEGHVDWGRRRRYANELSRTDAKRCSGVRRRRRHGGRQAGEPGFFHAAEIEVGQKKQRADFCLLAGVLWRVCLALLGLDMLALLDPCKGSSSALRGFQARPNPPRARSIDHRH
ncbi:hypothetical protein LZ31DRAFT_291978 [Colletotrichum somersetense]|nr:hypothetical protein LZ31DRAFT_291978 [Colletotrichum somersetense]